VQAADGRGTVVVETDDLDALAAREDDAPDGVFGILVHWSFSDVHFIGSRRPGLESSA
jgi:hypothetical protein